MEYANPGTASTKCISTLMLKCPKLWSLSLESSEKLCSLIEQSSGHFDVILDNICKFVASVDSNNGYEHVSS